MVCSGLRHTLAALLVLLTLVTGVQAAVLVRLSPATQTATAGSTVTMTVEADSVADLGGFQFGLSYDPTKLQAVSATINPAFDQPIVQNLASGSSLIAATVFNNLPISGTPLTLATIDFTVLSATTSSIILNNVILGQLGGTEIPSASSGATIIANSYTLTYTAGSGGSISGATPQIGNYGSSGTAVTATANPGYHFTQWSDGITTATRIDSNITANLNVTASFAPDPVNGVCGSASGGTFTTVPATSLCNVTGVTPTVIGTGPWSWSCSGLNGGTPASCNASIDVTGPALTISTLGNGATTNNATLNISGTVTDASGIASLTINSASVTIISGSFSQAITLLSGSNSITTIATDTLGNSTTDSRTVTLDFTAPVLTVDSPADNSRTAQLLATVSGTVKETSTVTITLNNGTPQSAAITGSSYSATVSLASGLNTIAITATDLAGNTATTVRSVTYDNGVPSIAITNPAQDITTASNSDTISGTVSDTLTAVTVTMTAGSQTFTPAVTGGSFSQPITLPAEGTYQIIATATDETGNSASATRNVIYAIPVNGLCGSSSSQPQYIAPTINLCNGGTASTVTGNGPWNWTCSGSNGGSDASCSASVKVSLIQTITATANTGGSITPAGSTTLNFGVSQSYTITPDSGFVIVDVRVDQVSVGKVSSYNFNSITADHTIEAVFGADGVIDPANTSGVPQIGDALMVLTEVLNPGALTAAQRKKIDTAPMLNGVPQPDNKVDLLDVLVILRRVVGLEKW